MTNVKYACDQKLVLVNESTLKVGDRIKSVYFLPGFDVVVGFGTWKRLVNINGEIKSQSGRRITYRSQNGEFSHCDVTFDSMVWKVTYLFNKE